MWYWLGCAALVLILEVNSGTFYLLVLAFGMLVAAVTAALGLNIGIQLLSCTVSILLGIVLFRKIGLRYRQKHRTENTSRLFDYGQRVQVTQWSDQCTARVQYRGTQWDAALVGQQNIDGWYVIHSIENNTLLLTSPKEQSDGS